MHRVGIQFLSSPLWRQIGEAFSNVAISLRFVQEVCRSTQNSCGWGMTLLWLLLSCKLLNGSTYACAHAFRFVQVQFDMD